MSKKECQKVGMRGVDNESGKVQSCMDLKLKPWCEFKVSSGRERCAKSVILQYL